MSPFDYINAINFTKQNLFEDPQAHKDYNAWIVNKGLSYFPDTLLYANEMNRHYGIPKNWQFSFLLNSITKKKRFSKWSKKETISESLLLVKDYYGYSNEKAKQALALLSEEQLAMIEQKLYKGGK
jgi:Bacteriophage clamp loader A subunit